MAPAPSPNSTQVPRSFQSRIRENVSAPITSARLKAPLRRKLSAVASAKMKPEHTACRSKAAPWWMPSAACTATAVAGKVLSGVEVAEHDQVDRLGVDAGVGQRRARRVDRQMRGELALGGDVALPDAGALHDPLVRGVDPRRQFGIGQDPLRQIGTAAEHDRTCCSHETASCEVCA